MGFYGDESFLSAPVGAFQGTADYTPSDDDGPNFVNHFKSNSTTAIDFQKYVITATSDNIAQAKTNSTLEQELWLQ